MTTDKQIKQRISALKKAHKSPKIGKRKKGKKTIEKEKLQKRYDKKAEKHYDKIFDIHFKTAKDPKAIRERENAMDRMLGKPKLPIEHSGEGGGPIELDVRILDAMKRTKKKHNES